VPDVRTGPRRAVTGRALVLGTLVVLLVIVLASPLNRYFGSRGDVGRASAQLHSDEQQLANLNDQLANWSDPGFIQQQARVRLEYAMPGDTVYVVVHEGQQSEIVKTDGMSHASGGPPAPTWNQRLWHSVKVAGAAQ
jgi:cell division protein FtsB